MATSTQHFAPDSRNETMVAVASLFLALSWIAVSLRVYVRGFQIRGAFGRDDWLMLVTLAFFTLQSGFIITIGETEIHRRVDADVLVGLLSDYTLLDIAFYICTSIFLKLTLAVFFLRILIERWQRWVVIASVSVYTIYTITYLLIAIFQCGNPAHFLVRHDAHKCLGWGVMSPLNYVHASLNAISDWTFALVPILYIRRTSMPRQAKISVCLILAFGALGSVASVVRIAYIGDLGAATNDFYYKAVGIAMASTIEMGLGIVAGSLATLRPLLRSLLARTEASRRLIGRRRNRGGSRERSWPSPVLAEITELDQGVEHAIHGSPDAAEKGISSLSATSYVVSSLGTASMTTGPSTSSHDSEGVGVLSSPLTHHEPSNRWTTPGAGHDFSSWGPSPTRARGTVTRSVSCNLEGENVRRNGWEDPQSARAQRTERPRTNEMALFEFNLLLPDPESTDEDHE